jgi:hypothetical protein
MRLSLAIVSALGLGLLSAACPGPEPTPTIDPTLTAIQASIFTPSCNFSSCHSNGSAAGGLILASGSSFAKLVDVVSAQTTAKNQGLLRVKPGDPDHSFLMIKLKAVVSASYGDHMPDTGQQLSDAQLTAISNWITLGAQDD